MTWWWKVYKHFFVLVIDNSMFSLNLQLFLCVHIINDHFKGLMQKSDSNPFLMHLNIIERDIDSTLINLKWIWMVKPPRSHRTTTTPTQRSYSCSQNILHKLWGPYLEYMYMHFEEKLPYHNINQLYCWDFPKFILKTGSQSICVITLIS